MNFFEEQGMRTFFSFGLVVVVVGTFSGCGASSKRQAMIVGKWDVKQKYGNREISGKVEFRKDGTMTTEAMGMRMESKYKFLDDNNIEVEMAVGGRKVTEKNKIETLSQQQMVLVDPQGGKAVFSRAR
jgi:uncharacterized protein (TIGR03066 family)